MLQKILSILILWSFMISCGLQYTPPATPESQENRRKNTIEEYLTSEFNKDSAQYSPIAYGDSETIKPISYKELDSLYEKKYRLEQQNKFDRKLENEIGIQRQIVLSDTNRILFIENHLFSVKKNDTTSIYSARFEMDIKNEIRNLRLDEKIGIEPSNEKFFKIYTFKESFINLGRSPSSRETAFYNLFDKTANSLSGTERDEFINHTLVIMKCANKTRSLKAIDIIQSLVRDYIKEQEKLVRFSESFEAMEEKIKIENGKEVISGYYIIYTTTVNENEVNFSKSHEILMDEFYRITQVSNL
ncbi:MAG: hypothetical protein ACI9XP_001689 [Lentimonas sp.]|jgi:hypothetical protein